MRDSQVGINIASAPISHERAKHTNINCHLVKEKLQSKEITISCISSTLQLEGLNLFRGPRIEQIYNKMDFTIFLNKFEGSVRELIVNRQGPTYTYINHKDVTVKMIIG